MTSPDSIQANVASDRGDQQRNRPDVGNEATYDCMASVSEVWTRSGELWKHEMVGAFNMTRMLYAFMHQLFSSLWDSLGGP